MVDELFSRLETVPVLQQYLEILDVVYRIETELAERWSKTPQTIVAVSVQCDGNSLFNAFLDRADRQILAFKRRDNALEVCEISGETITIDPCGYFYWRLVCRTRRLSRSIGRQARIIRCSEASGSVEGDEKKCNYIFLQAIE
jgi:hypothetical protein